MATGASRGRPAAYSPAVVAPVGTCEFLSLCTIHESSGAAGGLGRKSSAGLPVRRGRTASALQPRRLRTRVPEAFRLFLTSPLPRPPSPGTVSYPVSGGCCSVPDARCSAAPATKCLSSSCRLCLRPRRLGLRSDPHPQPFLRVQWQMSRWLPAGRLL